ncbi:MAG: cobalamin B12-binding domain-containing protein [Desulfatiglans sp.]|nr:cobalamin B12-binding domain-containing protein [Desulfatiglans sp.]
MKADRKIRVLMSKTGLDGHDRGAKVVTYFLRNEGMEVVYLGQFQTPESVVRTAIEEDVDVIGLSSLSGEHMSFVPSMMKLISQEGLDNVLVLLGGTIPRKEMPLLKEMGVDAIFESGSPMNSIIEFIKTHVSLRGS